MTKDRVDRDTTLPPPDPAGHGEGSDPTGGAGGSSKPGEEPITAKRAPAIPAPAATGVFRSGFQALPEGMQPVAPAEPQLRAKSEPGTPGSGSVLVAGEIIDRRYRILRFIAKGGMGAVYEAQDLELGDRVALKTLLPSQLDGDQMAEERFKRGIQLARKVTHPAVCRLFEFGVHEVPGWNGRLLFLTMELLEGETLSSRIRNGGPFGKAEALPIIRKMAEALEAAHDVGVVHRDFKSSHVMLVPGQRGMRTLVTDFGLARHVAGDAGASLTGSAAIVGTPAYMAPEQVLGQNATAAADIYALGMVVYEMMTGTTAFAGDTPLLAAVRRLHEPAPSPRVHVPDLEVEWEAAILRCLERDPGARFARAMDFVAALEGASSRPPDPLLSFSHSANPLLSSPFALSGVVPAPATLPTSAAAPLATGPGRSTPSRRGFNALAVLAGLVLLGLAATGLILFRRAETAGVATTPPIATTPPTAATPPVTTPLPQEDRVLVEARAAEADEDWEEAAQRYGTLFTFYPQNLEYGLSLAHAQALSDLEADSLVTLNTLRKLPAPFSDDPRIDLQEAWTAHGRWDYTRQQSAAVRAATKARARAASSQVAEARHAEGVALLELGELKEATAAVDEARRLYATAGMSKEEAGTSASLGDILDRQGDRREALQVYEETLATYRRLACGSCVANGLLSVGRALQGLGDLAGARGELEQARAMWRTDDDEYRAAVVQGDLAAVVLQQGALSDAKQMAEESLVLLDELNNESFALVARGVLGDCLVAKDQLSDAREEYKWMAGLCEKLKARRQGAEVALRMARLCLEEGAYAKAEALARQALEAFSKEALPDDQARTLALLAMALLGSKQPAEALAAADRATAFAAGSQTMLVRLDVALSAARVRAASLGESISNPPPASLTELIGNVEAILSEATSAGFAEPAFEARLLLGELEITSGRLEAGHGRLSALEKEAAAKGFTLLARKAASAGGK